MKILLEIDTNDPGSLRAAHSALAAIGGSPAGTVHPKTAPVASAAPVPPAAPMPSAPAAPPAPPPSAPAPVPPAAPAASPSNPPPVAAAPAPAPTPPAPSGAATMQAVSDKMSEYAKVYGAKGAKARLAEMAAAFGAAWTKVSDIPAEQYANVLPWFQVQQ